MQTRARKDEEVAATVAVLVDDLRAENRAEAEQRAQDVPEKCATLVDLEKCCKTHIFLQKVGFDTAENEPAKI